MPHGGSHGRPPVPKWTTKNEPGHLLKGIAGMLGTTALTFGISKAVQAIRKGVTKRRKLKFGDEGAGRGPEARAIRREIRGTTGSWLHKMRNGNIKTHKSVKKQFKHLKNK